MEFVYRRALVDHTLALGPECRQFLYVIEGRKLLVQCANWFECQSESRVGRNAVPPRCGLDLQPTWNATCHHVSEILPHVNVLDDPPPAADKFIVGPGQAIHIKPYAYHVAINLEPSTAVSIR